MEDTLDRPTIWVYIVSMVRQVKSPIVPMKSQPSPGHSWTNSLVFYALNSGIISRSTARDLLDPHLITAKAEIERDCPDPFKVTP